MYQNKLEDRDCTLARLSGATRRGLAIAALVAFALAAWSWQASAPAEAGPHAIEADVANRSASDPGDTPRSRSRRVAEANGALTVKGKVLSGKLNLNTATEDELQTLPGIGASKARRILAYRKKNGKFARVRDLRRVKGIGYKTLKKLSPYLTVKGQTTLKLE